MGHFKYIQNEDLSIEKVYIEDATDFENNLRVQEVLIASDQAAIQRLEDEQAMMLRDLPETAERTACIAECDAKKDALNASIAAKEAVKVELQAKLSN